MHAGDQVCLLSAYVPLSTAGSSPSAELGLVSEFYQVSLAKKEKQSTMGSLTFPFNTLFQKVTKKTNEDQSHCVEA